MPKFFIPGDILTKVSAIGAPAPASDYYAAVIDAIEAHATKVGSNKVMLSFENGFSSFSWMNAAHDDQGNVLPGLSDKQVRGRVAAQKALFLSAGYTNEQLAQGATDEWLTGKTVYLEWHSAEDLGAEYGEVAAYYTKAQFDKFVEQGAKPSITGRGAAPVSAGGGSSSAAPPAPAAGLPPAPAAAAAAPAGAMLPPPPTAATA